MSDERAMRFGYLLSEIEGGARRILNSEITDIPAEMIAIKLAYDEAWQITVEVSREVLDKVAGEDCDCEQGPVDAKGTCCDKTVIRLKEPLPADTEIKDVLPDA